MIQIDLFCYRMPLHPLDERFDRRVADLTHRLPDRGEGRRDDLGDHDVIKTDKRDILRHADTGVGQRTHGTRRNGVRHTEDRVSR